MRKLWVVLASFAFAAMTAVPAGAATVPPGLGGCRLFIAAQDSTLGVSTQASLSTSAQAKLGQVRDKKLKKLLTAGSAGPLLDWCGTHYPLSSLLGV